MRQAGDTSPKRERRSPKPISSTWSASCSARKQNKSRSAAPWLAGPRQISAWRPSGFRPHSQRDAAELRLEKRHKDLADPQLAPYSNLRLSIDQSDPCVPSNAW